MKNKWKVISLIFIVLLSATILMGILIFWGEDLGYETSGQKISIWLQGMLLLFALLLTPIIITNSRRLWAKDKANAESLHPKENKKNRLNADCIGFEQLAQHCRQQYGFFWLYRVKKIVVYGLIEDVEYVIPGLISQKWLITNHVILLWGGDFQGAPDPIWIARVKRHCGRFWFLRKNPIDSAIWILPKDYTNIQDRGALTLEQSISHMQQCNKAMGWDIPFYAIEQCNLSWSQKDRQMQALGIVFKEDLRQKISAVTQALAALPKRCLEVGMYQAVRNTRHAFLLAFSQFLEKQHLPRLTAWFTDLFSLSYRPMIRGLFFRPTDGILSKALNERSWGHHFHADVTLHAIIQDIKKGKVKRFGLAWSEISCLIGLLLMLMLVIGLGKFYVNNRTLIKESHSIINQLHADMDYRDRLQLQQALRLQIGKLEHQVYSPSPLYFSFGLQQQGKLLKCLWKQYYWINQRNVVKPFLYWLERNLMYLPQYHANELGKESIFNYLYDILKSYMMLGNKNKVDALFLSDFVTKNWSPPRTVDAQEWQKIMPKLIEYWAESMTQHSDFIADLNTSLIAATRKTLISQIGVQNAEETIYDDILTKAKEKFRDQNLEKLLAGIDYNLLFTSDAILPGIYTREAWEDVIKREFSNATKFRKEHVDWVLAEGNEKIISSITSAQLTQRLTQRYFDDYGKAWQQFLNTLQWQQADTIPEAISQLNLLSDPQKSPVFALLSLVKYQAEVEYSGDGLSQEILHKAQNLIKRRRVTSKGLPEPEKKEPSGPLTPKFKPILDLLKSDKTGLSLQTYMLRAAQVRVKLQNVISSIDPQSAAEILATNIFQGKSTDLVSSRDYGNLIVTQLGGEWAGMAYSLFKRPLEQAWQVILDPASKSFNENWQQQVVYEWEKSFSGRYPFKDSENDASLVELSRFLRPDAGIIDRFIHTHLVGVLVKQGDKWVPHPVSAEGLHFSSDFLETLNLINQITSQVFASGDAKIEFDLMPRSGHSIVKSELIIDKQKLLYFNQLPIWNRMRWPGDAYSPFAQLSWSTDGTGLKLYEHHSGDWAWIRLLEKAFIHQLDSSRYELSWEVASGHKLKYILRTQSGLGPLSLLKLKSFRLPKNVFEVSGAPL